LGIDLNLDGPTPNDPKDRDNDGNRLQNFPVLTSAVRAGGQTTIKGKLNAKPNAKFLVQFFVNFPVDGDAQGKQLLGQQTVLTNKKGNVTFTFRVTPTLDVGNLVTATATNKQTGDTSEFSASVTVV
jgi:hypothetical protein